MTPSLPATADAGPGKRSRIGRIALGDLLQRAARRFPARTALIEGTQQLSFSELDAASNRIAHALLAQGLHPGDRVAMLCDNSIPMVIAMFGIYKAGLVWVPINTALAVDAIGYILEHAQARHLVIDSALLARDGLRALGAAFGAQLTCCGPADAAPPAQGRSLAQRLQGPASSLPEIDIDGQDLVQIMYTSGTTGRQKGVMHSHASVQSVLLSNLVEWGIALEGEVFGCHLPLFHVGQHVVLLSALLAGAASVLMKGFDAEQLLGAIARHRITLLVGLPMMYRELLGPGQVGEIVWRGPNVMLGYYKDPEATAHCWRFGWHHSGDLGQWDEDGELLFLDRIKDMIKTGGENVPSIKVEEVLLRHPGVRNAAVIGLPHERWGEAITAFLVVDPEQSLTPDEIAAHCRVHLGPFEVPKAFVQLPALPVTSTGKVQKFALRQQHLDHFGEPT